MRWACLVISAYTIFVFTGCKKTEITSLQQPARVSINNNDLLTDSLISIVVDTLNLSGIDYIDNIYNLSLGDTIAYPVYHSTTSTTVPCSGGSTDTTACKFDETDVTGDGKADVPSVRRSRLIVDRQTGAINLSASYQAGLLGPNPLNGAKRVLNFFYRLNDESKRRLKKVSVQVVFYTTPADIPESVKAEIAMRQQEYSITSTTSLMAYAITYQPKRPPLIVIVSRL